MNALARPDLEHLGRAVLGLALLALAVALGTGSLLAPETAARAVGVLVLSLAVADLLLLGAELGFELWRGAGLGSAVTRSTWLAIRRGALPTLFLGTAWLLWAPLDAPGVAAFALIHGASVVAMSGQQLGVRRWPRRPARSAPPNRGLMQRRRLRLGVALGCVGLVGATLLWTAHRKLQGAPDRDLACPLLPNAVVPPTGLISPYCPFQPFDRVIEVWVPGSRAPLRSLEQLREQAQRWPDFVEWTVLRGSERITARVPVIERSPMARLGRFTAAFLLAATILTTALTIAWNTASRAGVPLLLFYTFLSCALIAAICAGNDESLHLVAALSVALLPSTIAHMALGFPRDLPRAFGPSFLPTPYYAIGALLAALTLTSFRASGEIWILLERLVPGFAFVGWSMILLSALETLRRRSSGLERSRARAVVLGSAVVAAVSLAIGQFAQWPEPLAYRIGLLAVTLLPISVGVAIVRYSLFDLHPRLRRLISSLIYSALGAAALTVGAALLAQGQRIPPPLGDSGLLFSAVLVLLLAAEPLRDGLLGRARELVSTSARRRRASGVRCARQLAELREPDACARILAESLAEGLRPRWVAVFLRSRDLGLRPAYAVGEGAPIRLELAREADAFAAPRGLSHLPRVEPGPVPNALTRAGVDVVVPLKSALGTAGLVLLGEREAGGPYTLEELDHLSALAAQGAVALENARLAREVADAERSAVRGNLAVGLAHELGKPLRVIEDIARSVGAQLGDSKRAQRELQQIASLSGELIGAVYGFVQEARRSRERRGTAAADVVTRAVYTIDHLHGANRVSISLAPDLPEVLGADELVTVLANLLDNALLASAPGDTVHLVATADEHELRFEVVDDGQGMDEATAARAFDLFFTTRGGQGGSGVGLALCREIVEQLGGRMEIRSHPGRGTRVAVHLPRKDARAGIQPVLTDLSRKKPDVAEHSH